MTTGTYDYKLGCPPQVEVTRQVDLEKRPAYLFIGFTNESEMMWCRGEKERNLLRVVASYAVRPRKRASSSPGPEPECHPRMLHGDKRDFFQRRRMGWGPRFTELGPTTGDR
jgi:hypothetical protein